MIEYVYEIQYRTNGSKGIEIIGVIEASMVKAMEKFNKIFTASKIYGCKRGVRIIK